MAAIGPDLDASIRPRGGRGGSGADAARIFLIVLVVVGVAFLLIAAVCGIILGR